MDRLSVLRTCVLVADHQSFAEAARRLHVSPTAASRGISELEKSLGVTLFRRTTRSVSLTPEGAVYVERCRQALEALDDADRTARGENTEPHGRLVLSAPVVFGRIHVMPMIATLMRQHPTLIVQLMLQDRIVRLVEEGVDVALRIASLRDSSLHATRIAEVRRVLVACPEYLERRGEPGEIAALVQHDIIAFDNIAPTLEWRFEAAENPAVRINPRFLTNSVETAIDAALAGLGITRAYSYQVEDHIRSGRLRRLLTDNEPPPIPVNLVYQQHRRRTANVSALISAALSYCRERDWS